MMDFTQDERNMMMLYSPGTVSYTHLDVYKRQALTPDGNLTLVDDVGSPTKSGKQFITAAVSYTRLINYQLAQQEDKTAIFDEWCSFLNFFDSSIHFELSFMNLSTDAESLSLIHIFLPGFLFLSVPKMQMLWMQSVRNIRQGH